MAKKQRLNRVREPSRPDVMVPLGVPWASEVARCALGVLLVLSLYFPCDSVAVEQGYAIFLLPLGIVAATAALVYWPGGPEQGRVAEYFLIAFLLWLSISIFANAQTCNLWSALNEYWVWLSFATVYVAARRVLSCSRDRQTVLLILLAIYGSMAFHAIHQKWISHPRDVAAYQEDPEAFLEKLGFLSTANSAVRLQYEGRLYAAESMATFSLSTSAAIVFGLAIVLLWQMFDVCQKRSLRIFQIVLGLLFLLALLTTGSKIVFLLLGILVAVSIAFRLLENRLWTLPKRFWASTCLVCSLLLSSLGASYVAMQESPSHLHASLAYRFEYWLSSFRMLFASAVFGVAPGNFQQRYSQFKLPYASETIADPHNFLLEAATSGGVPCVLLVVCFLMCCTGRTSPALGAEESIQKFSGGRIGLLLGSALGLILTWTIGLIFGAAPDVEAYILGLPFGLLIFLAGSHLMGHVIAPNRVANGVLVFVLSVLTVSGGWSVPGIMLPVWMLLGASFDAVKSSKVNPRIRLALGVAGVLAFVLFWTTFLFPMVKANAYRDTAQVAVSRGDAIRAEELIKQGIALNPWNPALTRQLVSVYAGFLRSADYESDLLQLRRSLSSLQSLDMLNPRMWQFVGEQEIWVYQRTGDASCLANGIAAFEKVVSLDPVNAAGHGQLALLCEASGYSGRAKEHWATAKHLDETNPHDDARWNVLFVLPVTTSGEAQKGPIRIPLKEASANRS